ncbi:MAG: glycosyltransferase family 9 protein [Armatimonadetes bacterium]|nr:glycosyltransferase family 9 protein [Armatimonadota bacterium]MDW8029410.1 glycosyltransferase family 9 protein [Armatimonadota bacterium]
MVVAALTLNHIGDVLFIEPAITSLKFGYPNARLIVLTSSEGKAILTNHPDIDEILIRQRNMKGWLEATKTLRSQAPELVVSFSPSSLGLALCAFLSGSAKRYGFAFRPMLSLLFTETLKLNHQSHFVDNYLALAELAGGRVERRQPKLFVTDKERLQAKESLKGLGWDGLKPLWGFHPFSSVPRKEWGWENYAELIKLMQKEWEFVPIIFGGPKESKRAKELAQTQAIFAVGALSLREFIAAVTWCDVFIGSDSGPTHIAAVLGIPTLALFGPTDPERFKPLGTQVTIVCSPTSCMGDISVEMTMKELTKLLSKVVKRDDSLCGYSDSQRSQKY